MILDEFLVKLGVISDPKDIDTFVGGLQKVATVATAVVGVVGGLTAAVTSFFGGALDGLDGLANLSKDTDTELAYIQKLGYAAQVSGSSIEAANASVKGLSQTIGEAASGLGRGKAAFEAYGLSAKNTDGSVKSVGQVLEDVQGKMAKLSKAEQLSMLGKLGIDQSMIGLLNSSNAEMGELFQRAEDLGLVTAAGADAAQEFNDSMSEMHMVMGAIRTNIAVGLAPQLTNIVGKLRDWLIRNKELIREGINKAVTVILALWRAIMRAVDVVDKIISKTIGWKAALTILGGALLWFNKTMILAFATNPITLIFAAIAGLILLVDDLITFMEGGESMFDWSWALPIFDAVNAAIAFVKDNIKAVSVAAAFLGTALIAAIPATAWTAGIGTISGLVLKVIGLFTGPLVGALSMAGKAAMLFGKVLTAAFVANPIGILIAAIAALAVAVYFYWDEIKGYLGATWDWLTKKFDDTVDWLSEAWSRFTGWVEKATAPLVEHFTQIWNIISDAFGAVVALLTGDFDGFLSHVDGIIAAVQAVFTNAWAFISTAASEFFGLLGVDVDGLVGQFSAAWESIKTGFSGAMGFITKIWDKVSGSITKGLDAISGTLNWLGSKLGLTSDDATEAAKKVSAASGMTADAQAAAHPSNNQSSVNNSATINAPMQVTQNITTSDPKAAGDYAADGVKREHQRAAANYNGSYKQ